jgi:YVTN family beta-propeller protein
MRRGSRALRGTLTILLVSTVTTACGASGPAVDVTTSTTPPDPAMTVTPGSRSPEPPRSSQAPGVYSAIAGPTLSSAVRGIATRVYVPDNDSNDVRVIDPRTFRVVRTLSVGLEPQHVSPSWDMRHLYVGNVYSNSLSDIDPRSGRIIRTISIPDPYNLYFAPDGALAIDVAEGRDTLYFYDPKTWTPQGKLEIPFNGPDHLDFSRSGRFLLLSTEYAGVVVKIGLRPRRILGTVDLGGSAVDVKLSPDGSVFFVANQVRGGVCVVDPIGMRALRFIPTGAGAHGFAIARDGRHLYVSNRLAGSISVIDTRSRTVVATWLVGGSPDMLQVSADGKQLWASNRFDASVSVIDTRTGNLLHTIAVGIQPHGLTLFPQPGRYSLGHNGVYR